MLTLDTVMWVTLDVCTVQMFKNKAQTIADKLLPAFNTPTGIPYSMVNIKT